LQALRSGWADRIITGGAEACIVPGVMAGFCRRPRPCIAPFQRRSRRFCDGGRGLDVGTRDAGQRARARR
jgi:hypothetical protein